MQDLTDKMAIADLISKYNRVTDEADFAAWAECFTHDGIFHGVVDSFRAHEDLAVFTEHARALLEQLPNERHFVTNLEIELDGDNASARCFMFATSTTAETGTRIIMTGGYDDELARVDGSWRFRSRTVFVDGATSGWADAAHVAPVDPTAAATT